MDFDCGDDAEPATVKEVKNPSNCSKCSLNPGQFSIRGDLLCASCFLTATEHRFKVTLRTQVGFARGERMLVAVSGGANSMTLAHMVSHALDSTRNKRHMNFQAHFLYVDDTPLYPYIDAGKVISALEAYEIPISVVHLESVFPVETTLLRAHKDAIGADFLYFLIRKTIIEFARRNEFPKVLIGESGSRIASKILSWVCKGRGAALWQEAAYTMIISGVEICRPLKDILDQEIGLFCHLEKVIVTGRLPFSSNFDLPGLGSVDVLAQDFLAKIQEKFPSSTHTILRTASKIVEKPGMESCSLCLGPRDFPMSPLEGIPGPADLCYACGELQRRISSV